MSTGGVERQVARAERGRVRRPAAPRQRPQARDQLGESERLGHVVVGAEGEPVDEVVDGCGGGEHQHPAVGLLAAQGPADLVAVDAGQVAVEHHHVVGVQARLVEGADAVVRHVHRHALTPQPASHRVGDLSFVLGHEHSHSAQSSERRYAAGDSRPPRLAAMSESTIHEEPREALESALFEIKRVIIGQDAMLERVMVALLAGGHVLLEGVPGLAKTLTIKTLASAVGGSFSRIQFTPDLVPSDLVGTRIYRPDSGSFDIELGPGVRELPARRRDQPRAGQGPVGAARGDAGAAGHDRRRDAPVPLPFLVLATQNPIESEGTYPLPEAQVDRFLMKILVDYPRPATRPPWWTARSTRVRAVEERLDVDDLLRFRAAAADVIVDREVVDYAVALADATRRPGRYGLTEVEALLELWREPARADRARARGPRAGDAARAASRAGRATCPTWLPRCCATGWCSATRAQRGRAPGRPARTDHGGGARARPAVGRARSRWRREPPALRPPRAPGPGRGAGRARRGARPRVRAPRRAA